MNKILCIVGSTATGKTKKAIEISRSEPSIIVSADSRQVYRGMDIVTGKDHPRDVNIYGIDLVDPDQSCSVSVWYDSVMPVIKNAWESGVLPIIVGGTGLYLRSIVKGIETMSVPINESLREQLSKLSVGELADRLVAVHPEKFNSLNDSDRQNPRRLIRAIEIGESKGVMSPKLHMVEAQFLGLRYLDHDQYAKTIRARVIERINSGAIEETKELLSKYSASLSSMSAIGYQSIVKHLGGELSYDEMIEDWVLGELQYAKRQATWFRKEPVIWYDITN